MLNMDNIKKSESWQSCSAIPANALPPKKQQLLTNPDYLTGYIKGISDDKASFHVISSHWGPITAEEAQLLNTTTQDELAWIRIIEWRLHNTILVKAKTIIPKSSCHGSGHVLLMLGDAPLGGIFANNPLFAREKMQIRLLTATHPYYQLAQSSTQQLPEKLWARRSIFSFDQKPLLVSEVFLPALFNLHQGGKIDVTPSFDYTFEVF